MQHADLLIYEDATLPALLQALASVIYYLHEAPVDEEQLMNWTQPFTSSNADVQKCVELFHVFVARLDKAKVNPASVSTDELDILSNRAEIDIKLLQYLLIDAADYAKDHATDDTVIDEDE